MLEQLIEKGGLARLKQFCPVRPATVATLGQNQARIEPKLGQKPLSVATVARVRQENEKNKWDRQDWQCFYDERAAILEYDGYLTRNDAEQQAYEETIIQWLNVTSPKNLDDNRCAHCGKPVGRIGQDAVPFLTGGGGHAWLHHGCHTAWLVHRRQEAVEALQAIGIRTVRETRCK